MRINLADLELCVDVDGLYEPAFCGFKDYPPEPSHFYVEHIWLEANDGKSRIDLIGYLPDEVVEELSERACRMCESERHEMAA